MSMLNNAALVRSILSAEGLQFATPPVAPSQRTPGDQIELTTLSFGGGSVPSWSLVIFSHENAALLRLYAHIAPVFGRVNEARALELINAINYQTLFESSLDYARDTGTIRFKSAFRANSVGLPVYETRMALQSHVLRANYLHSLLLAAYASPNLNVESALANAQFDAQRATGQMTTPFFL